MILFRQKYPWWFGWNLELQRFINRVWIYLALMNESYPSTDDHQWVQLDYAYPDAATDLNRWLPLVKWLLAIPHYIVLFFLEIAAFLAVIATWLAILFTGRYSRGMFSFVEGVFRWHNRVAAYAFVLVKQHQSALGQSSAASSRCPVTVHISYSVQQASRCRPASDGTISADILRMSVYGRTRIVIDCAYALVHA